jgi:hypothetical protein
MLLTEYLPAVGPVIIAIIIVVIFTRYDKSSVLYRTRIQELDSANHGLVTQLVQIQQKLDVLQKMYDQLHEECVQFRKKYDTTNVVILGIWPTIKNAAPLNTKKEIAAVFNSGFEYTEISGSITRRSIVDELDRKEYTVLHIGGHASAEGVYLSDTDLAHPGWWARLVEHSTIRAVFILACDTLSVSDALYDAGIEYVIAVRSAISDQDAVAFAESFYRQLRKDFDIVSAFSIARLVLSPDNMNMVELRHRRG